MTHGLNSAQSEAVRYLDGPCLVLAGAGSGKTRVITQKIAHLIEDKGFEPRHIAAVTFTNKAAKEMQERIGKLMEGKTSREGKRIPLKQLTVCTFHSLGVQILRMEAEHVGLKPQFSIMDSDDCFGLIQEQLGTTDKKLIRGVQGTISLWKNGMVDPEAAIAQAANADEHQAALVYRNYVATLHAYQAVDFDDLIRLPAELFARNEAVQLKWQNRLRYFLVDEYQDTNACQYQLLKLLAGGSHLRAPAFTAVGDDDQAIYGWRGATLDNLRGLQTDFPDLKVIKLEQNYRSTVRILEAANAVIANNPKLFDKKLWSEHGMGDPIAIHPMNDEEHEAESVVFRLSAHKFERRAQFRDYAILYRGNHQARLFEQILRRERIPYVLSGGQSFFDKAEIKDICAYLRLIANPDDDPAFIRAITTPRRGVGNTTLEALGTFAGQAKVSLFEAAMMGGIEGKLQPRQLEPLRVFCESMVRLADRAAKDPATVVLDDLMAGIHYEAYLYDSFDERQAQSRWTNTLEFLDWLKRKGTKPEGAEGAEGEEATGFDNADGFGSEGKNLLELTQTVALMSMLEGREEDPDAVRLSTLHASKGLEYPHVFLVGVEEGILPHCREDEDMSDEKIEEERRLMYVGITRAQRSLHVSWCKKRKRARDTYSCQPSRFIGEMKLEEAPAPVDETPAMSPKDRLGALKALLGTGGKTAAG
ncbi:UvrD-helicase domain-containing protein [Cupriavidus lacunae]|uniref:ATP-dependent DNA helicase Rep n=1 Tax=Cupriavidus lacunae TaxID=2666307 RepID=A0A370N9J1_9BURK|nr:UvrD-helicase domain-containing protein [Cupriavidus lacunae]RDK02280.1 ATP-dependent DNA helicase Rep [Cupriavidus lacunae]